MRKGVKSKSNSTIYYITFSLFNHSNKVKTYQPHTNHLSKNFFFIDV